MKDEQNAADQNTESNKQVSDALELTDLSVGEDQERSVKGGPPASAAIFQILPNGTTIANNR